MIAPCIRADVLVCRMLCTVETLVADPELRRTVSTGFSRREKYEASKDGFDMPF